MASILDVMFARNVSVRIYGLGAIALAVNGFFWGDYAVVWQPDSYRPPGNNIWGYALPVLPLLAGLAMQWKRTAQHGALLLLILYALGEIFLDVPRGAAHPREFGAWYGVFEHLALAAAGLIAYAYCKPLDSAAADRLAKFACVAFGICLIYFGVAHHVYLANTTRMVPAWLPPGQTFWAYATGAAHIAAGLAILSGVLARPAAMLLTAMFVLFTILVHVPAVAAKSATHFMWAENAVNLALIGSAWVIAASLPARQSKP